MGWGCRDAPPSFRSLPTAGADQPPVLDSVIFDYLTCLSPFFPFGLHSLPYATYARPLLPFDRIDRKALGQFRPSCLAFATTAVTITPFCEDSSVSQPPRDVIFISHRGALTISYQYIFLSPRPLRNALSIPSFFRSATLRPHLLLPFPSFLSFSQVLFLPSLLTPLASGTQHSTDTLSCSPVSLS
ncbi:hypothetical protein ACRALDRAFT_211435 [Sodiomyces alcalophilus JCM 7366]|uniref:uncharacterized protein n=1 Tax=Sodiomyces alcalophilus JCM 7366 TaxID=591952 RepID=UPI0039B3C58F